MSAARPRLLVATFNPGKRREFVRLVSALRIDVLTLADAGIQETYEETGQTFEENARGKARHYALLARLHALADDSGLEVDALGGRPGVLSARYGGPDLDDPARCRLLLQELAGVPAEKRTARYIAVAAIAAPAALHDPLSNHSPDVHVFRGVCEGLISPEPRGQRGFGYDPIFFYPPHAATFGELDDKKKDRVSHRGQALRQVAAFLRTPEGQAFLKT